VTIGEATLVSLAVLVGALAGIFGNWLTKPKRMTDKVVIVVLGALVAAGSVLAIIEKSSDRPEPPAPNQAAAGDSSSVAQPPTSPPTTVPGSPVSVAGKPIEPPPPSSGNPAPETTVASRTQYLQATELVGSPNVLDPGSGLSIGGEPYVHGIGIECAPGADGGVTYRVGTFTRLHATLGLADGAPDSSVIRNDTPCEIEFSSNGTVLKTVTVSPSRTPSTVDFAFGKKGTLTIKCYLSASSGNYLYGFGNAQLSR
jgi:hypothetical protein